MNNYGLWVNLWLEPDASVMMKIFFIQLTVPQNRVTHQTLFPLIECAACELALSLKFAL